MKISGSFYIIFLLPFILTFCTNKKGSDRDAFNEHKRRIDSVNQIKNARIKAYESIKRGNLILFRDYDDFTHAQEYFLNNYDIVLIPPGPSSIWIQQIMDSAIFDKYGEEIVSKANLEILELYKNIPNYQNLNGAYTYADTLPNYPGGDYSFYCDIYKIIPAIEACNIDTALGHEITVKFVIGTDGKIRDLRIIKKMCSFMDKRLLDAIKNNTKLWDPAILENNAVPYEITYSFDWNKKEIEKCN